MRTTHLSPLGFLMAALNIQTVTLARSLHVDASLVSKWKSGGRSLTERSVYFDDVISFLLSAGQRMPQQFHEALSKALPTETISTQSDMSQLLRRALSLQHFPDQHTSSSFSFLEGSEKTNAFLFDGIEGIRSAVGKLLTCAENLPQPGELLFIDTTEYRWLVTDEAYAARFAKRLLQLLARGFRVRFVIHYSASHEHSIQLFTAISPLIFRRNADWYYYEYYDDTLFRPSLFLLNRTLSLLSLTTSDMPATMMVFSDLPLIMRHEALAEHIISRCRPIFENILTQNIPDIASAFLPRRRGALYAFLPAPAFLFVRKDLLLAIMEDNHLGQTAQASCLTLNQIGNETKASYIEPLLQRKDPFIQIFQLEKMEKRAHTRPFVSASLSLSSGSCIKIHPRRYALQLRNLAEDLIQYDNFSVVLVSEADNAPLPAINCWCKQYTWLIQMDQQGFRLSDEASIVSAASVALERCIRHVPPERKDKKSVHQYLLNLAEELEHAPE